MLNINIPSGGDKSTAENFIRWKQRAEANKLKVWNIGNSNVHNMPEVTLNLPGRDQKVEEYKQYLRNLAKAGIFYTTYAHMGNGIWSSERETTRGNAPARAFNLATAKGYWANKVFEGPLTHGRKYSKDELWENYTHFIKQVVPVAEELGMRVGIHPDDPPVPELGGCQGASSETSTDMYVPWRLLTVPTSVSVSAAELGWRVARGWVKTASKPHALSPRWASCGRFISAT